MFICVPNITGLFKLFIIYHLQIENQIEISCSCHFIVLYSTKLLLNCVYFAMVSPSHKFACSTVVVTPNRILISTISGLFPKI
jgi:hypothetical protein